MSNITEQYVLAKWTLALTDKISTDSKCNASAATLSTLAAIYALLEPEVAIVNMSKCQLNLTDPEIKTMVKKYHYLDEKCLINS